VIKRGCEICLHDSQAELLHHQTFLLHGSEQTSSHDIVACPVCHFLYAMPAAVPNTDYYVESDHHLHLDGVPAGLVAIHGQFLDFIETHCPGLNPGSAILDIGASMGHFLNSFKKKGYRDLRGIEASQQAHRLAKERYGIDIASSTLESFETEKKYQLITLCGVLEHFTDLRDKVARMASLLVPGGYLFVAVPDASRFATNRQGEPFLEFASEHVNFFTPLSLDRLLAMRGFRKIAQESAANDFYGNHQLMGLYCRESAGTLPLAASDDAAAIAAMKTYVAQGKRRLHLVDQALHPLVEAGEPVVVWGTGQLTARLLASSTMARLNIAAFVDNSRSMQGRSYFGLPVNAPSSLAGSHQTVLIASLVHAQAIQAEACRIPGFSGRIVTLPPYDPATQ
jgi:SAM-dependent methyltransferase